MKFKPYPKYKASGVDWLGEVPSTWDAKPLKRMTSVNDDVLPESTDPDDEIDYVDISSVSLEAGIRNVESIKFSAAPSRARRRVCDGDVIVSTVRTYLKAIAPIRSPASNLIVSTGFAVIRPRDHFHPDFARYSMQAGYFIEDVIARSTGISYPAINATELVAIKVAVPPISEQGAISLFLDRETAKLDTLISKQERLIELLQEKRQAMISHAVTKGLPLHGRGWSKTGGGTNSEVPMKDSGIEWLGMVPEHWAVGSLGYLSRIETGSTPERSVQEYWNGDIPWIKTGEINYTPINEAEEHISELGLTNSAAKISPAGTLLMAMYGQGITRGRVAILGIAAAYNQACAAISFGSRINVEFGRYFFMAAYAFIRDFGNETSQMNLSSGLIAKIKLTIPPHSEQLTIIKYLDEVTVKIDKLLNRSRRNIDLMREHRTALISAAVTGKIDVREAA